MAGFEDLFLRLEAMGLTDVLLPFLLIFAIVFAVLQRIQIFGKENKNINMIVALIMGFLVVIPHITNSYPPGGDVVDIINSAIPSVSVFIVAIVMLLIMIGVFGVNVKLGNSSMGGFIAFVAFIIVAVIFANSAGWFGSIGLPPWLGFLTDPDVQAMILVLLVFGIIVAFVTGEPKNDGDGAGKLFGRIFDNIGKSLEQK